MNRHPDLRGEPPKLYIPGDGPDGEPASAGAPQKQAIKRLRFPALQKRIGLAG